MSRGKLLQRHRHRIYFRNPDMDFYFMWVLGHQTYGGAEFGECFHIASRIRDGDPESWAEAWIQLASQVEGTACAALESGHRVSAREASLRASTYYRAALACMRPTDHRFGDASSRSVSCFRNAATLHDFPIEPVEVAFEGKSLPGYFARVDGEKRRTLIVVGGAETSAEELYFWGGTAGVRRGYHVLMVDLPGQGNTPSSGLYQRRDTEVPLGAIVDYALSRSEIDAERLGLYGISLGGYMVCRAVAFEKRIKACAANAPMTDVYRMIMGEIPAIVQRLPGVARKALVKVAGRRNRLTETLMTKFCWQAGVSEWSEGLELARAAKLDGLVSQITCPMLCMIGTGESDEAMTQAREFYDQLAVEEKEWRLFTEEEGADAHCQVNNFSLMHQVLFDWLDDVLA